jgi:hypothetical protein
MTEKIQRDRAFKEIGRANEQKFNIQIAADGRWFHDGGEIRRKAMVKLFASVLKRDSTGLFWLETPIEKGLIEVVDAPFIAAKLVVQQNGVDMAGVHPKLGFITNVDEMVPLDVMHPIQMLPSLSGSGMCPYIEVRDGLLAKLSRPVYYELASYASAGEDGCMGVWSQDQFFALE